MKLEKNLTSFMWEGNPVSTCTMLLYELSKLFIFFRTPWPFLYIGLVTTRSSSHLSLFFSPHTDTLRRVDWTQICSRRNLYSLSQRRNRVDWSNFHHYQTSKLVYNWVTEVSITIYWTLLQSLNWSLLSQFCI